MTNVTLDLSQWDALVSDLKQFVEEEQAVVLKRAATAAGVKLDSIARNQLPPAVRKRAVARFWTDKQKRWWWATLRAKAEGKSRALPGWKAAYKIVDGVKTLSISGAYKRAGTTVKSLSYRVEGRGLTTELSYGTNLKYARYTLDKDKQSKYHRGNWTPPQTIAEKNIGAIQEAFADKFFEEVNKAL